MTNPAIALGQPLLNGSFCHCTMQKIKKHLLRLREACVLMPNQVQVDVGDSGIGRQGPQLPTLNITLHRMLRQTADTPPTSHKALNFFQTTGSNRHFTDQSLRSTKQRDFSQSARKLSTSERHKRLITERLQRQVLLTVKAVRRPTEKR